MGGVSSREGKGAPTLKVLKGARNKRQRAIDLAAALLLPPPLDPSRDGDASAYQKYMV
jgi:hypothetical protein